MMYVFLTEALSDDPAMVLHPVGLRVDLLSDLSRYAVHEDGSAPDFLLRKARSGLITPASERYF